MRIFTFLFFCLILFSCRKECFTIDVRTPAEGSSTQSLASMPLEIGNYWVYQNVVVDTLGNETIVTNNDTVKITGDTLVAGLTYFIFKGFAFTECKSCKNYFRDSAGCLVDPSGRIYFSEYMAGNVLASDTVPGHLESQSSMTKKDTAIQVPAGIFSTLQVKTTVHFQGNYPWQNPRFKRSFYAKGVGLVKEVDFLSPSSSNMEGRLLSSKVHQWAN